MIKINVTVNPTNLTPNKIEYYRFYNYDNGDSVVLITGPGRDASYSSGCLVSSKRQNTCYESFQYFCDLWQNNRLTVFSGNICITQLPTYE